MTDLERARKVFMSDNFAVYTGCSIDEVGDGYAKCSLTLEHRHRNALGMPMGGVVFTLADFAYAVASNFDRDVYISASSDVHFMAAAKGERLIAEAKQIRSGRRTCLYSVAVTDELGTQVAYIMVSGMMVRKRGETK